MRVEMRPIGSIRPYPRNPRVLRKAAEAVARSIKAHGFRQPIVVDAQGEVIVGHARLEAAKLLGLAEVPVHEASDLTAEQVKAYRLADNRTNEYAAWDDELLAAELRALEAVGAADMAVFPDHELARLVAAAISSPDDDRTGPAAEEPPLSRVGDVWFLGEHRLVCGDSRDAAVVEAVLDGAAPRIMCTDPPYGVDYSGAWRRGLGQSSPRRDAKIANDGTGEEADAALAAVLEHFGGDVAYVWFADLRGLPTPVLEAGFDPRAILVWVKTAPVMGRGHYHWQHELCLYAVRRGRTAHWRGRRDQSTVYQVGWDLDELTPHPTQKPVVCAVRQIENHTQRGDTVYEPFSGSGTTLVACEITGRKARAVELDPVYVDVTLRRWRERTKREPRLGGPKGLTLARLEREGRP